MSRYITAGLERDGVGRVILLAAGTHHLIGIMVIECEGSGQKVYASIVSYPLLTSYIYQYMERGVVYILGRLLILPYLFT